MTTNTQLGEASVNKDAVYGYDATVDAFRAIGVDASGSLATTGKVVARVTGAITTNGGTVGPVGVSGLGTAIVDMTGTTFTAVALRFQASVDGSTWFDLVGVRTDLFQWERHPTGMDNTMAPRAWAVDVTGIPFFRVLQDGAMTGSVTIGITASQGASPRVVIASQSFPSDLRASIWDIAANAVIDGKAGDPGLNRGLVVRNIHKAADLVVQSEGASGNQVTLTVPASGTGFAFTYITKVVVEKVSDGSAVAAQTNPKFTTSNLNSIVFGLNGLAMAAGEVFHRMYDFEAAPLKTATANTAATIVSPAGLTACIYRITAHYYIGW